MEKCKKKDYIGYNVLKYGLTSENLFSKKDEKIIHKTYDDLSETLIPDTRLKELLLGRITICFWRLQKTLQIEQRYFINDLISSRNSPIHARNLMRKDKKWDSMLNLDSELDSEDEGTEEHLTGEDIDKSTKLLLHYETNIENRLLKLIKFFKRLS